MAENVEYEDFTAPAEEFAGFRGSLYGFRDYLHGAVCLWGHNVWYLALALDTWAVKHPDRLANVKGGMTVDASGLHGFLLYDPAAIKKPTVKIKDCSMDVTVPEESQPGEMRVEHDV